MNSENKSKLVAVVAGASGLVGKELVSQLAAHPRYSKVIILLREGSSFPETPKVEQRLIPQNNETIGGDEFYCCLGTTIKKAGSRSAFRAVDYDLVLDLARRAKTGGVRRIAVITAIASSPKSPFFYSQVKGETEEALRALAPDQLDIYQPSLLLGARPEFRLGERVGEIAAKLLTPIFKGRLQIYAPIQASDLARHMIEQTTAPNLASQHFANGAPASHHG